MEQIASLIEHCDEDETFAKYVLSRCLFYYPNHTWVVQAFLKTGHLTIRNPSISYSHGMRLIMPQHIGPGDLDKKIMRYCGEFLERFDVRRRKADHEETQERFKLARFR